MVKDLQEVAPCGMRIHYTVDDLDMVIYNDINGRGAKCDNCIKCSWKSLCNPPEPSTTTYEFTDAEVHAIVLAITCKMANTSDKLVRQKLDDVVNKLCK